MEVGADSVDAAAGVAAVENSHHEEDSEAAEDQAAEAASVAVAAVAIEVVIEADSAVGEARQGALHEVDVVAAVEDLAGCGAEKRC